MQEEKYQKDIEIFLQYRILPECPLRKIGEISKKEYQTSKNRYQKLIHRLEISDKEKESLEGLIRKAWGQYVDLYCEGDEKEYLLKRFSCTVDNMLDDSKETGMDFYCFPNAKSNKIILV